MEKRHYFALDEDSTINSIKRVINEAIVTGYDINGNIYSIGEEGYSLSTNLSGIQPYEGVIAYSSPEDSEI
jgi:hypothetical protein